MEKDPKIFFSEDLTHVESYSFHPYTEGTYTNHWNQYFVFDVGGKVKEHPSDFRRTTMIVNEIDLAIHIYKDILGMSVYYDKELVVSGKGLPTEIRDAKTRLVILQCNHRYVGMLGLLQYLDPPLPEAPPKRVPHQVQKGDVVLVINTDDVQQAYAKLSNIPQVVVISEPHLLEYPKPEGGMFRILGMSFFDPNGYFVELNQFL